MIAVSVVVIDNILVVYRWKKAKGNFNLIRGVSVRMRKVFDIGIIDLRIINGTETNHIVSIRLTFVYTWYNAHPFASVARTNFT